MQTLYAKKMFNYTFLTREGGGKCNYLLLFLQLEE